VALEKVKTILGKERGTELGLATDSTGSQALRTWHKYGWFHLGLADKKLICWVRLDIRDFTARPRR
jgi:hypothetical protein